MFRDFQCWKDSEGTPKLKEICDPAMLSGIFQRSCSPMFLWKLIHFKPSCCRLGHSCLIQRLHSLSIWFPVAWPKTYLIGDTIGPMRASLSFLLYSWTQSFLKISQNTSHIPSNIDPKWSKHPTTTPPSYPCGPPLFRLHRVWPWMSCQLLKMETIPWKVRFFPLRSCDILILF